MSDFNLTWRKYGLKDNPYFNAPLTIEGGTIPITSFIGRKKERQELKRVIEMGSDVRFMVFGEAGVGKTSLVNFVRNEASKEQFFTPAKEIEINRLMSGNEFIILTLSVIYDEVKKMGLSLKEELRTKLEALYELTRYGELSYDVANIAQLNT
ncbi:MAG: ATP-binding protein [Nanoarchaeota archaeon]